MYSPHLLLSDLYDEKKFGIFIYEFSLEMISRSSVTLYEDQYKFFKAFNSEKLLVAFVEFMFEDIEPEWLTDQEKVIFDSLRIRMNNQKKKSYAWTLSHWWWRPKKQTEEETKKQHKNNTKTTEKQEVKDISISNNNILISKDINTETKVSEYWNQDINKCLDLISRYNWWLIDWTKQNQRRYSKLLIDKLNKLESIKEWKFTWQETLEIILKVISHNKYYSSKITSPENIYRNLSVLMQQCKADIWKANTSSTVLPVI